MEKKKKVPHHLPLRTSYTHKTKFLTTKDVFYVPHSLISKYLFSKLILKLPFRNTLALKIPVSKLPFLNNEIPSFEILVSYQKSFSSLIKTQPEVAELLFPLAFEQF